MIHEAGIPAPNVDHSTVGLESGGVEQSKRQGGLPLKPADISRALRFEHVFPMLLAFHLSCSTPSIYVPYMWFNFIPPNGSARPKLRAM
jgi:hypothetical protein